MRASFLETIVARAGAAAERRRAGIEIHGILVTSTIDLSFVHLPFKLAINDSALSDVILDNAQIEELDFGNTRMHLLEGERLRVDGGLELGHGFWAARVHLVDADIHGYLQFDGGEVSGIDGIAIIGDGLKVGSSITFRAGFIARTEVRLPRAQIARNLDAHGGQFLGEGDALYAAGAIINGDVFLFRDDAPDWKQNFVALGRVSLDNAQIHDNVTLDDAEFHQGALGLHGATIGQEFRWRTCGHAPVSDVYVDLSDATIGGLADARACWPQSGRLHIDGLQYRRFVGGFPSDVDSRLDWVSRHANAPSDIYRQLARILGDQGDAAGARQTLIAMEFARRSHAGFLLRLWNWILDLSIGYGYATWRAGFPGALFVVFGMILFALAYRDGGITPSDKDASATFYRGKTGPYYPAFSAAMYSLDTFLPIINFGQKERWAPNANAGRLWRGRRAGWYARAYLWMHIALGWLITTLFVAGVTGLVQTK